MKKGAPVLNVAGASVLLGVGVLMGVQISEIVPKKEISFEALKGRKISIDAFNTLYQFLAIIRQYDGTPLMDSQGQVTSHLSGLYYRTIKLVEAGVKPVYVFDGEPPKLKYRVIEERREMRKKAEEAWEEKRRAGRLEEARVSAQAAIKLTGSMISDSRELLEAMGVPCVQAPSEGEAQAAFMCSQGDVWAAGSQDFDSLLFGAPRLLRNLTISGRKKVPRKNVYVDVQPELIELDEALSQLQLTREKLIWVGMLVGTDFNEKVEGIGPKKALKLAQGNGSFEEIVGNLNTEGKTVNFDWREVQEVFLKIPTTKDYKLQWKEPSREKVLEFLCEKHDFSKDRVENAFNAFEQSLKGSAQQSRLEQWLGKK